MVGVYRGVLPVMYLLRQIFLCVSVDLRREIRSQDCHNIEAIWLHLLFMDIARLWQWCLSVIETSSCSTFCYATNHGLLLNVNIINISSITNSLTTMDQVFLRFTIIAVNFYDVRYILTYSVI